jgi:hypothetical protein
MKDETWGTRLLSNSGISHMQALKELEAFGQAVTQSSPIVFLGQGTELGLIGRGVFRRKHA